MNVPVNKPATYEELFDLPDNVVGEIIAGEVVAMPRPGPRHAVAAAALGSLMFGQFDRKSSNGPGGWWILGEPECHLGADILVPDIAGWRQSTMPDLPETAWFDVTPDWICEIISTSTARYDRTLKRDIYAREQITHYWIVDPIARLIEVFALIDDQWVLLTTVKDDETVALPPFDAVPFDLSRLWA